jgi:hypothetical protein
MTMYGAPPDTSLEGAAPMPAWSRNAEGRCCLDGAVWKNVSPSSKPAYFTAVSVDGGRFDQSLHPHALTNSFRPCGTAANGCPAGCTPPEQCQRFAKVGGAWEIWKPNMDDKTIEATACMCTALKGHPCAEKG